MPQVMKPQPVQACLLAQLVPPPVDVTRFDRGTDRGREDESVILPGIAQLATLVFLPLLVLLEVTHG